MLKNKYRGGIDMKCLQCGKEFHKYPCEKGRKFCSQGCYYEWQKGQPKPKPDNFSETMRKVNPPIGRKVKKGKGGYVWIFKPEHINARQSPPDYGYVQEHVMVMSDHHGRMIRLGEVIHHINGVKDDNRIENLVLCGNASKHTGIHVKMGRFVEELIRKGLVEYDRKGQKFGLTERLQA